jgi:hypothetical protein
MRIKITIVLLGVSACLLVYTGIRAYRLPFVHDEGVTYLLYLLPGASSLLDCYDANNHFLNSILMYLSSKIFGASEFALRLPNLLSHVIFMFASFLFVRRCFKNSALLICAFIVLNVNPFMLDFFSLARGYGIAMALVMLSLVFLFQGMNGVENQKSVLKAFWCAGLAAFANMSFLNFLVAVVCTYLLVNAINLSRSNANAGYYQLIQQIVAGTRFFYKHIILMLIVLVPLGLNLNKEKALYYGGQSGFWSDTIVSLINCSGYEDTFLPVFTAVSGILVVIIVLLVIFMLVLQLSRKSSPGNINLLLVSLIAVITMTLISLQHFHFGTPYPMDRTAIHFIIFFKVICVLLVEWFVSSDMRPVRVVAAGLFVVMTVGLVCHAVQKANLRYSLIWKYDADIKEMLGDVKSDLVQHGGRQKIRFGINWRFEPSINYYYAVKRPEWLPIVTRDGIKGEYDYYYVRPDDRGELLKKNVEIFREYPLTGNILARTRK